MERTYWYKQEPDRALFPDIEWGRPETRQHAGKLLVIGGNVYGFTEVSEAYNRALASGAGACRALMPDAIQKTVGSLFDSVEFCPSTPSGSFAKKSLGTWLDQSAWADGILLAGGFGRNSETNVLIETYLQKYAGPVTLVKDSLAPVLITPETVLNRPETTLVMTLADLQKIYAQTAQTTAITSDMDLLRLIDALHEFSRDIKAFVLTSHRQNLIVAAYGLVSTTRLPSAAPRWRIAAAASAAVWWLQNPSAGFEALTTAQRDTLKRL